MQITKNEIVILVFVFLLLLLALILFNKWDAYQALKAACNLEPSAFKELYCSGATK